MRHQKYREWLLLSLYDELGAKEQRALERHLDGCSACRAELSELREFHHWADEARPRPDEKLLDQARAQFRGALSAERRHADESARAGGWWGGWNILLPAAAMGGLCLLSGLGLGFLLFRNAASPDFALQPAGDPESRIVNVRWIDAPNDEIEILFDSVQPVRIRGNVSEPRIREVLSEALLNSGNPGLRLRAVRALQETDSKTLGGEVKRALIHSLKFDENAGVRRRALHALSKSTQDPEVQEALVEVLLSDENPGLRVAAIGALEASGEPASNVDPELLRVLREKMDSEQNDYIRLRSKAFLQEARFQ